MSTDPLHFNFNEPNLSNYSTQLTDLLNEQRQKIDVISQATDNNWATFIHPLEELDNELERFFTPLSHLNSVCNSEQTRSAYNDCIPLITEFSTECGQNQALFKITQQLDQTLETKDQAQTKILERSLRGFKLSGVDLTEEKKKTFQTLSAKLSQLTTKFEENVLDATESWTKNIDSNDELIGLPDYAISAAKEAAKQKDLPGYLLTLHAPCYIAVMQYADNRELRQQMHRAYCTRASEQAQHSQELDNKPVIEEILNTRLALATLLGFKDYAEKSLATKMVDTPEEVLTFLWELVEKSRPQAQQEYQDLTQFAKDELGLDTLEAWDVGYAAEKLKQKYYAISDQELRPYFPAPKVIDGLFTIVAKLFSVEITEVSLQHAWHPDVTCYQISYQGEVISHFYFDLYARSGKRGGAWMTDAQNRYRHTNSVLQKPIAFVTCNFPAPIGDQPALLSHDDVICLFHEFGHSLQHMLTEIDHLGASGITGVPWDAVEVCSQFLENWAWQKECMPLISSHFETNEPLPDHLLERMQEARHFQSAMQMIRQLEFSLFDFILHQVFDPTKSNQAQEVLDHIRSKVSVTPTPEYNRFQNSFSHIFAGGYAAGYYSYKWAEVMAADAFSLFLEKGLFDQHTSGSFKRTFLASGGAVEPLDLFIEFRGRKPEIDALLQDCGIRS